jgi:uncharacterized membrane protein YcaP (DUF421 family)
MSLLPVVGHTLAIYVFVVVILSRVGRSLLAGLTHGDYLVIALLGSAVETGLYHGSDSLSAGIASAATLMVADRFTSSLMNRWPRLRRLLAGAPVVLVHDGQLIPGHLRQVRLSEQAVRAALRKRGYGNLDNVHLAIQERSGRVGVVPMSRTGHSSA